jgi:hypothetical protein
MKVELYLKNINQEMIGRRPKREGRDGWQVSWPKSCCVWPHPGSANIPGFRARVSKSAQRTNGFFLRHEREGGMFWDPSTTAVYKVDEEAYMAMLALEAGCSDKQIASSLKVPIASVRSLVKQLKTITAARGRDLD